jgi:peroxiredoxin
MALTPSAMMDLGTPAPAFALPDVVSGETLSLDDVAGEKATVIMFICAHCPYVVHVERQLAQLGCDYQASGVGFVAISANSVRTHPQDAPDRLKAQAERVGFTFPYLYDESQDTARAYLAACTPDFYVFDAERRCAYRGQLDDSRPSSGTSTGADIRAALDIILTGAPVDSDQTPSIGCNIKWHPGS